MYPASFLLITDDVSPAPIQGKPSACSLGAHNFHSLPCILSLLSIESFSSAFKLVISPTLKTFSGNTSILFPFIVKLCGKIVYSFFTLPPTSPMSLEPSELDTPLHHANNTGILKVTSKAKFRKQNNIQQRRMKRTCQ